MKRPIFSVPMEEVARVLNQKLIQEWVTELTQALPRLEGVQSELSRSLNHLFKRLLNEMTLVTREEWDVQSEVLARTRQRLAELEKKVAALEAKNNVSPENASPIS